MKPHCQGTCHKVVFRADVTTTHTCRQAFYFKRLERHNGSFHGVKKNPRSLKRMRVHPWIQAKGNQEAVAHAERKVTDPPDKKPRNWKRRDGAKAGAVF